jgi:hypothetical protein
MKMKRTIKFFAAEKVYFQVIAGRVGRIFFPRVNKQSAFSWAKKPAHPTTVDILIFIL